MAKTRKNGELPNTKLGQERQDVYPIGKIQTNPTAPEWVTRLEQWGTETEIRQLGRTYGNRTARQKEIDRREKKLRLQERRLKIQQITQSWKQASRYTSQNKHRITYARRPIVDIDRKPRRTYGEKQQIRPWQNVHVYVDWLVGKP